MINQMQRDFHMHPRKLTRKLQTQIKILTYLVLAQSNYEQLGPGLRL